MITYHFITENVMDSTTTSEGYGWSAGPWGGWGGWGMGGMDDGITTTEEQPRTMGILTVDLVDPKSNQVVWRGQATEDNIASSEHGEENQVRKSAGKMFEHFPPKHAK